MMKIFKRFFSNNGYEWGVEPLGPLSEITKESVLAYLDEVASSYRNKDTETLSRLIAEKAEFHVSTHVGDTVRKSKLNRYSFLAAIIPQIGPPLTFDYYDIELTSVLEESTSRWVVKCLAKYQFSIQDQETTNIVSEQELTVELNNGYVKVTNGKIKLS